MTGGSIACALNSAEIERDLRDEKEVVRLKKYGPRWKRGDPVGEMGRSLACELFGELPGLLERAGHKEE